MATTEQTQQQDEQLESSPTTTSAPLTPQKITTITSTRRDEIEMEEEEEVDVAINTNSGPSSGTVTPSRGHHRDSTWLELEVCREFCRGDCSRSAEECRYAHPTQPAVIVKDGKVTCCFDFLKVRITYYEYPVLHVCLYCNFLIA